MYSRQLSRASILAISMLWASAAKADTTYDISFKDTTGTPTFSSATGTFTINAADLITSFNVSFQVLKAYSYLDANGSAGETLTFNGISSVSQGLPATYNPATGYFGTEYNYSFELDEFQAGDHNNGAFLGINGGYSALGPVYSVDALSQDEFDSPIDGGTWSVSPAIIINPTGAPEPASAALLLGGLGLSTYLIRRRKRLGSN